MQSYKKTLLEMVSHPHLARIFCDHDENRQNKKIYKLHLNRFLKAPRKPDWDLKRDIAPRLEKLERRTQRAIAELIRERLREEDLANAVTAGASRARATATDDEEN